MLRLKYEIGRIERRQRDPPKVVVTLMAGMTRRLLGLKEEKSSSDCVCNSCQCATHLEQHFKQRLVLQKSDEAKIS